MARSAVEKFGHEGGSAPMNVTRDQKIKALQREISYRGKLYPRWVNAGKMTQDEADAQLAYIRAVLEDYERQPWPQLRTFMSQWLVDDTMRMTFLGVPIRKCTRDELMAIIGFSYNALIEMDQRND